MLARLLAAAVIPLLFAGSLLAQPITIAPGRDYWVCAQPTALVFGAGGLPPIPANFFGPGSEPFTGEIRLIGNPASPSVPADTIIERTSPSLPVPIGGSASVPIQLVALDLRSAEPIHVMGVDFNVFFGIDTAQPRTGSAVITRTHALGGACGYSAQFTPRIRFRQVGTTTDLFLALPFPLTFETARTTTFPRFSNTPIAPLLPQQGPNFFPIDPISTTPQSTTPGFDASWIPSLTALDDCNHNGIDDLVEILVAGVPDANMNGVPDYCEVLAKRCFQDSFPDAGPGWLQRYSNRGELRISIVEPPEGEVWWLSAAVPGRWIIYNYPIAEQEGAGSTSERTISFDLGNTPGEQVSTLGLVQLKLSPLSEPTPPPPPPLDPPFVTLPVPEHEIRGGAIGLNGAPLPAPPFFPWPGRDPIFVDPQGQPKEVVRRREVPGVSELTNQCGPGAVARSLEWMKSQYRLAYPATIDTVQELLDRLSLALDYSDPEGIPNANDIEEGLRQFITFYQLRDLMTVMQVADPDPAPMFEALKQGCDVIGIMYFLDAQGMPRFAHAVTVVGGSHCGSQYVVWFRDDLQGGDRQKDMLPDDPSHFKTGDLFHNPDGTWKLSGYGDNQWAGFVKICPTSSVQLAAANTWNTQASGTPAGGLQQLINAIIGGAAVSDQDRMNLLKWSCNVVDTLEFARATINSQCAPPPSASIILEMLGRARAAKYAIGVYLRSGNPADLAAAAEELGTSFDQFVAALMLRLDCNMNGIDDTLELARGDAHDANHDCIIDSCECLADWNHDGIRNVPDIFAFLSAWFAGDADISGDGMTTVPDIFAFLSLWFAGC